MRYIYSVARFVPDVARGEFINMGILVGSEETGEWALQTVSRDVRASRIDDAGYLPEARRQLAVISTKLDRFTESRGAMLVPDEMPAIDERWVAHLANDYGNMLQFSQPHAVSATTAQEAIDKLWRHLIAEPDTAPQTRATKHRAVGDVKRALRRHLMTAGRWKEGARLVTKNSHARLDFAVHNGKVVQITQCWSFQVNDQDSLLADIKSWGWTIRDLRHGGGQVVENSATLAVDDDFTVAAVFVPPTDPQSSTLREAQAVFSDPDVSATGMTVERADEVGMLAARSLGLGA